MADPSGRRTGLSRSAGQTVIAKPARFRRGPLARVARVMGVVVMLAGCAARRPPAIDCEALRRAPVTESNATRSLRERVERGLLPLVALAGVPDSAYPVRDRMERYAVPGVSIAVVDDGRIA